MYRRGSRGPRGLGVVLAGALASAALAGVSPAQAQAQEQCRSNTSTVSGASLSFRMCWDSSGTRINYTLRDTLADGRRAEAWISSPVDGVDKIDEVLGAGDSHVDWTTFTFATSDVWMRACTSDANTNRRCDSWR
ncbi:hypothetical protein [Streptomyces sp. NPDC014995]|uniref:hypothetical protein n=1 Tax=Streptomyces sp. NPDC014995 TaxID=3364936 RepID=UPI0036FD8033